MYVYVYIESMQKYSSNLHGCTDTIEFKYNLQVKKTIKLFHNL